MDQHIDTWLSKQLVKCVLYLMQQFISQNDVVVVNIVIYSVK